MKNTILSFLVLAGSALTSFAQTTLQAGDIAFVAIQSGETGQTVKDRFAFILLKDIDANTIVNFTDNAVLNSSPVKFCKNEGTSRWTSTSAITAGTIVSISEDSITSSGSVNGGLAFSQSGDQILAYQVVGQDTLMLAGISMMGWETSCGSACGGANNNKTCLPSPLVNGVNAVGFPTLKKNAFFNLNDPSGTPAEILAAINNLSEVNLVAPYKLIGAQALSVDKATTLVTLDSKAALITFSAPPIFVFTHSSGLYSAI